jgi:acetyl esterase/lipase
MVLKYRLPKQRHTVPLEDAEQAMRIVRSHAAEWGVDTANVGIMGSSAGGHLATTLATHYHSKATRPDFQILLYPVVTMDKSFTDQGTHDNLIGKDASPEMEELYSNEKHVTDDTPRAFIIFSSNDRTVPLKNGFLYAQAMVDHKIPVSLHVYPDGYHGFGYNPDFKDADIWHKELLRWLKRNGK